MIKETTMSISLAEELKNLESWEIVQTVSQIAQKVNIPVYLVGGYVRDLLLKRPLKKDIDFVCLGEGSGIALAREMEKLKETSHVVVFKNFGTAQLSFKGNSLEFVGARKESYQSESRKPQIENGTLEDDQNRRDFTINAMAISLNQPDFGLLLDPFNGLQHLKEKWVQTPLDPDITFSDDPLRMFRAIRFATQLQFDIDADTWESIIRNGDRISILSKERIADELNKIIESSNPGYGFKLLFFSGLLERFFPEMVALKGAENLEGKTHKDNFFHTLEVLDNVAAVSNDLWLRWAAILHDIAKPATKKFDPKIGFTFHGHEEKGARMVPNIFRRLKLPMNEKMKRVQKLVRLHLRPIALVKEEVTDSAIRRIMVDAGNDLEALMILCRADITTKNPNKAKRYLKNFDLVEEKMKEVESKDNLRNFRLIINGEMIMKATGLPPGHQVGTIKEQIKQAVLEGRVPNTFPKTWDYLKEVLANLGIALICDPEEVATLINHGINTPPTTP